jgi:hypothetical protein
MLNMNIPSNFHSMLLNISLFNFTKEIVLELQNKFDVCKKEYDSLYKKTSFDLYKHDLYNFLAFTRSAKLK